jgi:hypothetical protein
MKLVALLFLFYSFSSLACNRSVNPNKVMLFVDTNGSTMESDTARASACERGETFVIIPTPSDLVAKFNAERLSYISFEARHLKKCSGKTSSECKDEKAKLDVVIENYINHRAELPKVTKETLDSTIKEFAKNNQAITTAIFSGHDGGGSVGGMTGRLNKADFFESMGRHYKNKPALKDELNSVLLWGCYTATPEEVVEWKANFPNLKILAGFEGVAPSNTQRAGSAILKDFLSKDHSISEQTSSQAVRKMINGIDSLNVTNAGVLVNTCDESYYYNTDSEGVHFQTFDKMKGCNAPDIEGHLKKFTQYFTGVLPHQEKELRDLYDYARKYDHCFDRSHPLEGDHVALLLFFAQIKMTFTRVFQNLIQEAGKEYLSLDEIMNGLEKNPRSFFGPKFSSEDIAKMKLDWKTAKEKIKPLNEENLRNETRAEILNTVAYLYPVVNSSLVKKSSELQKKMKNLIQLEKKMQNYLYELKPDCMDYLEWHWDNEKALPPAKC